MAGAQALAALHRQVKPFILRRLKSDVLRDLPPKVITDHFCELSPLQAALYAQFEQTQGQALAVRMACGDER